MNQKMEKYKHTPAEASPREVESWALLASADALLDAKAHPEDRETANAALRSNLVLWTIFQAAILEPENQLPHEIKVNILNLSRFVDRHTFLLFADFVPEKVGILVDINRNIAAGLATKPEVAVANDAPRQAPATAPSVRPIAPAPEQPTASGPQLGGGRGIEA